MPRVRHLKVVPNRPITHQLGSVIWQGIAYIHVGIAVMIKFIENRVPRHLPTGMTEFNVWVSRIIEISGLPNNETTRRTAAQFIFSIPHTVHYLSYKHIAKQLIRAASYQVAKEVLSAPKVETSKN